MTGLGTIANAAGIIAGGAAGFFGGRLLGSRTRETLMAANALAVIFLGAGGTLKNMLRLNESGTLELTGTMMMIVSLVLGALVGEAVDIDEKIERFGAWLKKISGSDDDAGFVGAFVTASVTVCVGAMAIIGAVEDGLSGDTSILYVKTVLDAVIILTMTAALGKGCIFSAIPVAIFQGSITLFASAVAPLFTTESLANLSYVGNILIFCVGINLLFGPKIRVANLLPSLIFAMLYPLE